LRLHQVHYDDEGRMTYPLHGARAPESVFADYLAQAKALFAAAGELHDDDGSVSADFDNLRWFDLPARCLAPS
jgi:hypothetical protein